MGNADTKLNFRKAVIQLTTKTQPVEANDEAFWNQFWTDNVSSIKDVFTLIPAAEIRALREESPSNLATLCYKAVEKLTQSAESGCISKDDQAATLNCIRLLTRILPYIFEDHDWKGFFWSSLPGQDGSDDDSQALPLAQSLLNALSDLLFCPDFTVHLNRKGPHTPEDLKSLDSCEYIWAAGVGFAHTLPYNSHYDTNRTEILKLLLTCFSDAIYTTGASDNAYSNPWITYFTSSDNRHALPLFTSLLNVVCAYDPVGYGLPYNHIMFSDFREPLVETCAQLLIVTLDHDIATRDSEEDYHADNLFVNYLSRIHRDEDFHFILQGMIRLLNNPLQQTYLPNSIKKIHFHQELFVLFWKMCDANKKFLFHVLKSSEVLEILVPILYHLNDARADQSRVGLMHIGVFILLLLSGERNFGVRLNKSYTLRVPMDIPVFTGSHADLLIIVFHKIITTGHQRLQPLFDCLLTIICNVSPYLKALSMVASTKLLHLLEAFSTPWFLISSLSHHHLVFFLLEAFNNIIQYQFDGNSNLIYTIIRKRHIFHQLSNLPCDHTSLIKIMNRKRERRTLSKSASHVGNLTESGNTEPSMEGSLPPQDAEPGTLKATLAATPSLDKFTEKMTPAPPSELIGQIKSGMTLQPGAAPPLSNNGNLYSSDAFSAQSGRNDAEQPATEKPILERGSESISSEVSAERTRSLSRAGDNSVQWFPTPEWVNSWKQKLPLQTIMRLLQVLVPQVEKICIDKGLTDETEILQFLQSGTLVGLLPVPHPILIRKYQANSGTSMWFRTYMWGIIYLRNVEPPIWYDTDVKLFEIQRI